MCTAEIMESRSIDFAKNASIDMMALNNKVVNMRRVVKRAKVHVISKLCKHITKLKNKKGSEEQKAKNLRKAQRFIDEIESMKKLKEDKVSKYALANTSSFNETSKISLLPGPRALARLADHPLMNKVVTEFREQHSDWKDLAAYLLIKQTGRRFKTKKQKQKKLAKCVENIHASETMTKAYIKERFGQDGLAKAELRFERKRKRPKSAVYSTDNDTMKSDNEKQSLLESCEKNEEDLVPNQVPKQKSEKNHERIASSNILTAEEEMHKTMVQKEKVDAIVKDKFIKKKKRKVSETSDDEREEDDVEDLNESVTSKKNKSLQQFNERKVDKEAVLNNSVSSKKDKAIQQFDESGDDSSNKETDSSKTSSNNDDVSVKHEHNEEKSVVGISDGKRKKNRECVVKELKLDGSSSDEDDDNDDEDASSSENEDVQSGSDQSNSDDDSLDTNKINKSKKKKKKEKAVPAMLTKESKTQFSDPFFAGSGDDDDGGDDDAVDNMNDKMYDGSDDNMFDYGFGSGDHKTKSMFYNPHSDGSYTGSSKWSGRGRVRKGGFERKGDFERKGHSRKFGNGQRGRPFKNNDHKRNSGFASKEKNFNSFKSNENYGSKEFVKQSSTANRFSQKNAVVQGSQTKTNTASQQMPKEKLHPSWEASKKRKAEQSSIKAFQGSRITFDDD